MIEDTQSEFIIFSYSSGGRIPLGDLIDVFAGISKIKKVLGIDYKRNVMSFMRWTYKWIKARQGVHREYLFLLKR